MLIDDLGNVRAAPVWHLNSREGQGQRGPLWHCLPYYVFSAITTLRCWLLGSTSAFFSVVCLRFSYCSIQYILLSKQNATPVFVFFVIFPCMLPPPCFSTFWPNHLRHASNLRHLRLHCCPLSLITHSSQPLPPRKLVIHFVENIVILTHLIF